MTEKLTEEQKARYDRQIRVWGAEAQSRLQNAKVLVVGLNGLHPELVKNIVLAGVSVVWSEGCGRCECSVECGLPIISFFYITPENK